MNNVVVKCKADLETRGILAAEHHFLQFGYHLLNGAKSTFGRAFNTRMNQLLKRNSTFLKCSIDK